MKLLKSITSKNILPSFRNFKRTSINQISFTSSTFKKSTGFRFLVGASIATGTLLGYFSLPVLLEAENPLFNKEKTLTEFSDEALKHQRNQSKLAREHPGVFLWGSNDCGLVAPDNIKESPVKLPRKLDFFEKQALRGLCFGRTHAVAIDANGDLYQWGAGYFGDELEERADPEKTLAGQDIVRVQATDNKVFALSRTGTLFVLSALKKYQTGEYDSRTIGWKEYLWSKNPFKVAYYQLDIPNASWGERVTDFATGQHHLSVITSNNRLLTLQADAEGKVYGQLGVSRPEDAPKPSFEDDNRADYCLEFNEVQLPETFPLSKVTCGCNHTFVRTVSGRIFGFGANFVGQLGLGDFTLSKALVMIPQDITEKLPKLPYPIQTKVLDVVAGGDTSAFLVQQFDVVKGSEKLELYTCGFGQWGQLGNNRYVHVQGSPVKVQSLSGKSEFSDKLNKIVPLRIKNLSIGATHIFATVQSNSDPDIGNDVFAWGQNCDFQCGNGKRGNINTPLHPLLLSYEGSTIKESLDSIQGRLQLAKSSPVTVILPGSKNTSTVQVEQEIVAGFGVSALYSKIII